MDGAKMKYLCARCGHEFRRDDGIVPYTLGPSEFGSRQERTPTCDVALYVCDGCFNEVTCRVG
jgi:DNA-directed RNA polymerase subunit RPC12/RpoP